MNTAINATELANLANAFIAMGKSVADATELATLNLTLKAKLANGTATFTFLKADGTTRVAIGTNKGTIVDNHYTFVGDGRAKNALQLKYFDLERNAFRSLNMARLISVAA